MARLEIQLANEAPVEVVILVNNKRLKLKSFVKAKYPPIIIKGPKIKPTVASAK